MVKLKEEQEKDPFRADKTTSLNREFSKRTARANQEAMKNVKKKAKGGNVGKILDDKASTAIRKGGGSISEKEMIKIMIDAGKKAGLFKKQEGGIMSMGKKAKSKKPMEMKSPKPRPMPKGRKRPAKPKSGMPFLAPKQKEMMDRLMVGGKPILQRWWIT